jgi:hypothetical protein
MEKVQEKSRRDEAIASLELFEEAKTKNRETFKNAIDLFNGRDHRRRGSVEFIYAALKNMKQFGVHKYVFGVFNCVCGTHKFFYAVNDVSVVFPVSFRSPCVCLWSTPQLAGIS